MNAVTTEKDLTPKHEILHLDIERVDWRTHLFYSGMDELSSFVIQKGQLLPTRSKSPNCMLI